MVTCSVSDCSVNHNKNLEKYTFHRFPQDPLIRGKWLKLIGRVGWSPTKNSTICSKHFIEIFKRKSRINTILAKGAIPTLFVPSKSQRQSDYRHFIKAKSLPVCDLYREKNDKQLWSFGRESLRRYPVLMVYLTFEKE